VVGSRRTSSDLQKMFKENPGRRREGQVIRCGPRGEGSSLIIEVERKLGKDVTNEFQG
jgi:hypothetical protein